MLTRRELVVGTAAALSAPSLIAAPRRSAFVRTSGSAFRRGGAPYHVVGTNMWYAAYLGAGRPIGNRGRLRRELDRVAALGINNVRILGSSEFSPLKNSVRPTFRNRTRHFNEQLLRGLDQTLAELVRPEEVEQDRVRAVVDHYRKVVVM
jgi:mannan endo-1,4-beta-mannosidase